MSIARLLREKPFESLLGAVGSICVVLLGWTLHEVYGLNANIARLAATSEEHTGRLNAVRDALPDLRVKIAKEEIALSMQAALLVTEPQQAPSGNWVSAFHFLDSQTKARSTYVVSLKGPNDKSIAYMVTGCARGFDRTALSFNDLTVAARDAGQPSTAPTFFLVDSSFVLHRPAGDLLQSCDAIIKEHYALVTTTSGKIPASLNSWEALTKELNSNSGAYQVSPQK